MTGIEEKIIQWGKNNILLHKLYYIGVFYMSYQTTIILPHCGH